MTADCTDPYHIALWIEAFLIFLFLLIGIVSWTRRVSWPTYRIVALICSSIVLLVLFSARPVRLKYPPANVGAASPIINGLVPVELKKANDEIQYRIQQEDTWFHYKFLFVGGLFAGLLTAFKTRRPSDDKLVDIVGSSTTCFVLALACVVALAIDIHLRNNIIVIQQLALWIRHYAEPSLLATAGANFQPWEAFLRTPGGMHADPDYGFLFYPHLHFLTWFLYVLYLTCFQWIAHKSQIPAGHAENALLGGGFICVHLAIAAFAFVGHYVPGALEMRTVSWTGECWASNAGAAWFYLLAALLLMMINSPYAARFFFPSRFPLKSRDA